MSASKDGKGMYGTTFKSNFVAEELSALENLTEVYIYFNTREDIKIINNSWGDKIAYLDKGVKNNIIGVTALDILNKLKEDIEKYYDANKVMLRMYYLGFEEDRDYLVMKVKGKNFLKME